MKLKFKKRQSGFTLVELGIVVAIAAVIIGIGLVIVPSIMASNRANAESSDLPTIATKIQRSFSNQPNYGNVTQSTLIGLQVYPSSEVNGSTVQNRWGGTITATVDTLISSQDAVTLTETNVPSAECVQVVQGVERSFRRITVNGTVVKADGQPASNAATLGTQCSNSTTNTIAFTFGK